jgi:HrpA-like RNA helicase
MKKLNTVAIERTIEALEENKASAIVDAIKRFKETEAEDTLKGIAAIGKNLEEIGGAMRAYLSHLLSQERKNRRVESSTNTIHSSIEEGFRNNERVAMDAHNRFLAQNNEQFQRFIDTSINNHQF